MADASAGVAKAHPRHFGIGSGTPLCQSPRTFPGAGSGSSLERVPMARCRSRRRSTRKGRGAGSRSKRSRLAMPAASLLGSKRRTSTRSFTSPAERVLGGTMLLYEEGPHCQGHDSLVVTSSLTSVTVRRIVDGIEQRSSLYGLLREGQGHVGGCSGGPIP